jgi:hypothetical protein
MAEHARFPGIEGLPSRHDRVVAGEYIERHEAIKIPVACEVDRFFLPRSQELLNLIPSVFKDVS